MKKLLLIILSLLITSPCFAQPRGGSVGTRWREVDGSPNVRPRNIVVSDDVISVDENGFMSLDVTGNKFNIRQMTNGSFRETFNALATSAAGTVTLSIEQSGGGDLTMQFSDGDTVLDCTPACTIDLTVGSDTSPQANYIYIPQSTKVLTKSTTAFPLGSEHIKVGYFLVPSAAYVASDGVYINQNWNDHQTGTDKQGHLLHIAERERYSGAVYFSGIDPNGTDQGASSSYFNFVGVLESYFKSTAGVIYQMHRHTMDAFDSSQAGGFFLVF